MATIIKVSVAGQTGPFSPTATILTANDVVPYDPSQKQILALQNPTAGAITANIKGNQAGTVAIPGVGNVSVASGLNINVPSGKMQLVQLSAIRHYLAGDVVNITGGTNLAAFVIEV